MTRILPDIDPATYRQVMGHYPTGVCVVTAVEEDGQPVGMVVGSFTSVSLDPPLVAVFPGRSSTSWPRIARASGFCVNVLAADQQELCRRFASPSGEKFAGLALDTSMTGQPVLPGVVATIDCRLRSVTAAGDHMIALGRVVDMSVHRPDPPLIFFRGGYGMFAPWQDANASA
jgi:3-hydroxy-9,10-secoandrosta-1,3,5(10)-triene-9,17-dione monooxygenase reductase component